MNNCNFLYLPLEPYQERYTALMSCPNGWTESHFQRLNLTYRRIEGTITSGTITNGVVLDAIGRNKYALSQIDTVIKLIEKGEVTGETVIYTEDFWHPGIEALFYIRSLCKIPFKLGCFIHAQTFDEWDFCAEESISSWMRPIELGYAKGYDYIFTCSHILRDLAIQAGVEPHKIIKSGLPYNSKRLLQQLEALKVKPQEKEDFVLFSSRFDKEKNPHFFLDLVERCPDINFKLVNPRIRSLSNDETVMERLAAKEFPNLEIVNTQNKADYYNLLYRAKVQFNCALQDWVSWTLLEAITFKCNPVYPNWRDFPYELPAEYIYHNCTLDSAEAKVKEMLSKPFNEELINVVKYHDETWERNLKSMGL